MSRTTVKIITLKDIFHSVDGDEIMPYVEFRKEWSQLMHRVAWDGLGMGKKVKFPFGFGTLKPVLRKPKNLKVNKELSEKYGIEVLDELEDLGGRYVKVLWLNAYNRYPTISYYKMLISSPMKRKIRESTGIHKMTSTR